MQIISNVFWQLVKWQQTMILNSVLTRRVVTLVGQRLMDGWLEASHVLHRHALGIRAARSQIFAERGKNLRVQHLEPADSIHHSFQLLKNVEDCFKHEALKQEINSSYDNPKQFALV